MALVGLLVLVLALVFGAIVALAAGGDSYTLEALGFSFSFTEAGLFLLGALTGAVAVLGLGMLLAGLARAGRVRSERRHLSKESAREREERLRLESELEQERAQRVEPVVYPQDVTTRSDVGR